MNRRLLLAGLAFALAGCAGLLGPRTLTLSEAELTQRLAARFPLDRRLLEVLDVRIATPRVTLLPQTNRVGVALELTLDERLTRRSFPMAVALESGLRYDAATTSVRLADVRVQDVRIDGLPERVGEVFQRLGAPLLEQLIDGAPIHRFTPEQLKTAEGRGWRPDTIAVTSRGVEITLQPI